MGADQEFDAFLREWTEEYIWPIEDFLDDRDQNFLAERRSIELVQLSKEGIQQRTCGEGEVRGLSRWLRSVYMQ